jgi:hypothetical protein
VKVALEKVALTVLARFVNSENLAESVVGWSWIHGSCVMLDDGTVGDGSRAFLLEEQSELEEGQCSDSRRSSL